MLWSNLELSVESNFAKETQGRPLAIRSLRKEIMTASVTWPSTLKRQVISGWSRKRFFGLTSFLALVVLAMAPAAQGGNGGTVNNTISVNVSQALLTAGSSRTGTITLGTPAGSAGQSILIVSSNQQFISVAVSSVLVPAGQSSATFSFRGVAAGGSSTLTFSSANYTSTSVTVSTAVAESLSFSGQPSNTFTGFAIAPGFHVLVIDSTNHEVLAGSYPITLSIGTNPGQGALAGVTAITGSGNSFFSNVSISGPGVGYTLVASSPGLISATSTAFNIVALGTISATVSTSLISAGSSATGIVTLGAPAGTAGLKISIATSNRNVISLPISTVLIPAGESSATFSYHGAAAGGSSQLTFSASDYASTSVNVVTAPAVSLLFSNEPSNTLAGGTISPGLRVEVIDSIGDPVEAGNYPITLSIGTNPGRGVLRGTTTVSGSGSSLFSNVSVSAQGVGYTLVASCPALPSITSTPFNVVMSGTISTAVSSSLITAGTSGTGTITLGLPAGSSGLSIAIANSNPQFIGVPASTVLIPAGQSSATFTYSGLAAGSSNLTFSAQDYTSTSITVTTAPAVKLIFSGEPSPALAGVVISPAFNLEVIDSIGNQVSAGSYPITLGIGANPGQGTLQGITSITSTGNAIFSNVSVSAPGVGYTLIATSPGLVAATSTSFNISALGTISASVSTSLMTAGDSSTGTISIGTPAGTGGLNIAIANSNPGVISLAASTVLIPAGQSSATFGYSAAAAGGSSTLTFSAPNYTGSSVTVATAPPVGLVLVNKPTNTLAGTTMSPGFHVDVIDSTGHLVQAGAYPITLTIGANPGLGVLGGTTTITNTGNSFFSNISISAPGVGYTLIASCPGLPSIISPSFNILGPPVPVSIESYSINVNDTLTGTISLLAPAGAGGAIVTVANSEPQLVTVSPTTITVPAGQSTVEFTYSGVAKGIANLTFSTNNYLNATLTVSTVTGYSYQVPNTYFGMTVVFFTAVIPTIPYDLVRTWDGNGLDWADLNPSAGTYNFSSLDTFIQQNQTRGADIIYTLGRTPLWASSNPTQKNMYSPGECAPPTSITDWDNFVSAIATHAAGRIKYWELWNEPDLALYYCGDIPTLVTMVQQASQIIKSIDPSAVILAPGVITPSWLGSFLEAGAAASVDVIAFHGYAGTSAEKIIPVVSSYRSVMLANNVSSLPLWNTEGSWGGSFTNPPLALEVVTGRDRPCLVRL
jgi:hypothetical protein